MPPSNPPPFDPTDHLLPRPSEALREGLARPATAEGGPPASKSSIGPIVGAIIIVALLILGALYFWGAHLNATNQENNLPLILGNDSTQAQ